jgi:hypothetical protein
MRSQGVLSCEREDVLAAMAYAVRMAAGETIGAPMSEPKFMLDADMPRACPPWSRGQGGPSGLEDSPHAFARENGQRARKSLYLKRSAMYSSGRSR